MGMGVGVVGSPKTRVWLARRGCVGLNFLWGSLVFKSPVQSGFLAPKQRNRTRTGPRKVPRAGNRQLDR